MTEKKEVTFGERLKATRTEQGITQAELAKRSGVAQSTIAGIEADQYKSSKHALPIARALGISTEWLLTGEIPMEFIKPIDDVYYKALSDRGLVEVPIYSYALDWPDEEKKDWEGEFIGTLHADARLIGKKAFAIDVMSSAMSPDIIMGDTVIFEKGDWPPKPGTVVAARINDNHVALRTYRDRGRSAQGDHFFELVPKDPDYATYTSEKDLIVVMGEAMEIRRPLNIK